jgi:hypothetical protein
VIATAEAPPAEMTGEPADRLIARVLHRAHGSMEARDKPDAARAILGVAHSFADELAARDPRFDRVQFIKEVTEEL